MDVGFCCVFPLYMVCCFCCVFPFVWLIASKFSWMLAFAVFSSLHGLLLACFFYVGFCCVFPVYMACCWHVLIDVGVCSDFLFTWLVSSKFSLMLAFAVFFPLYGLLLASSHGCWFLLCFSSLRGLLLVTLCLIYSSICEIFMCGFYTTFINCCGRSDLSGTTTCLTTSVPAVKGKLLVIIFYSKTFSFFTQALWS